MGSGEHAAERVVYGSMKWGLEYSVRRCRSGGWWRRHRLAGLALLQVVAAGGLLGCLLSAQAQATARGRTASSGPSRRGYGGGSTRLRGVSASCVCLPAVEVLDQAHSPPAPSPAALPAHVSSSALKGASSSWAIVE